MPAATRSALLLLADGRLPTGGHAHSGGLEEAVKAGRVADAASLDWWLRGRLSTTGRVDAALAASTALDPDRAREIDGEAAARCPSSTLRKASRAQGRGLVRAGRRMWPTCLLDQLFEWRPEGVMWPVAVGAVALGLGGDAHDAALVAAQGAIGGPGWAATRLLGLDPFSVARILADLSAEVDTVAALATGAARADHTAQIRSGGAISHQTGLIGLDAHGAPLSEIGAQLHANWEARLFAS